MYESPITRITEDIMKDLEKREEGYLVESVRKEGFNIDKEELAKALRYDRDQYEKGFNDGRLSAEPEIIRCKDCKYASLTYDGDCKYCSRWDEEYEESTSLYLDGDFYCGFAERRS